MLWNLLGWELIVHRWGHFSLDLRERFSRLIYVSLGFRLGHWLINCEVLCNMHLKCLLRTLHQGGWWWISLSGQHQTSPSKCRWGIVLEGNANNLKCQISNCRFSQAFCLYAGIAQHKTGVPSAQGSWSEDASKLFITRIAFISAQSEAQVDTTAICKSEAGEHMNLKHDRTPHQFASLHEHKCGSNKN